MRIIVGGPVYRTVEFKHHTAMLRLVEHVNTLPDVELGFAFVPGDADVARARNIVAEHFLKSPGDVFVSIDADIWFQPEAVVKIARAAMNRDVVGALYMVRSIKERQPAPLIEIGTEIVMGPGQPLQKVKYLATGFMAVHRRVFEDIGRDLPVYMQTTPLPFRPFYEQFSVPHDEEGHLYLSEDYAFCQRALNKGYNIWLDPTIRLGHTGSYEYRMEDFLTEFPPPSMIRLTQRDGHMEIEELVVAGDPGVAADAVAPVSAGG